jgi:hypothetical protein
MLPVSLNIGSSLPNIAAPPSTPAIAFLPLIFTEKPLTQVIACEELDSGSSARGQRPLIGLRPVPSIGKIWGVNFKVIELRLKLVSHVTV